MGESPSLPVLLIRATENERDALALGTFGFKTVIDPYLSIQPLEQKDAALAGAKLYRELALLGRNDWVIVTSSNALKYWSESYGPGSLSRELKSAAKLGVRFAAVGKTSEKVFSELGITEVLTPQISTSEQLAEELLALNFRTGTALIPAGNLALAGIGTKLSGAGWSVKNSIIYRTMAVEVRPASVDDVDGGKFSAVVFRSPSAARAFARWNPVTEGSQSAKLPVVCGGPTTAEAARQLGLNVVAVASSPDSDSVASATSKYFKKL